MDDTQKALISPADFKYEKVYWLDVDVLTVNVDIWLDLSHTRAKPQLYVYKKFPAIKRCTSSPCVCSCDSEEKDNKMPADK